MFLTTSSNVVKIDFQKNRWFHFYIKSKSPLSLEGEELGSYLNKSSSLVVTWSSAALLFSLKIAYLPIDLKGAFLLNN